MNSWWDRSKTNGKSGFDKLYGWVDKLGPPVNKISNKLGSEAFWPTTLDKESDKAARILRSFCNDGFYQEEDCPVLEAPKAKQRVLNRIPAEVIANAKGLAIFTTMRTGLWVSGAGGSGVLVGRLSDGSWSPPSGLMLHTAGVGFLLGVDIYDCVMVINTDEAMRAFTRVRFTVGGEMSAVAGPLSMGALMESEVHKRRAPIFTYLKSRGLYAGVQLDGTLLIERTDENERFYGRPITAQSIISGGVPHHPYETRTLLQTIKSAQADRDVDESFLPTEPPPSDFEITESTQTFGIPDKDDPDPFGFLALEREGLQIREAGSQQRGSVDQFAFNPMPTSPIYNTFKRLSIDDRTTISRRSSWRTSIMSNNTTLLTDRSAQMNDMSTQTDFDFAATSPRLQAKKSIAMVEIEEEPVLVPLPQSPALAEQIPEPNPEVIDAVVTEVTPPPSAPSTQVRLPEIIGETVEAKEMRPTTPRSSHYSSNDEGETFDGTEDDFDLDEEPVVIHEVKRTTSPKLVTRARLVTVQKRQAPTLPLRNPGRNRRPVIVNRDAADSTETAAIESYFAAAQSQSRSSSASTYREVSPCRRSTSETSISSVDQCPDAEKRLTAMKMHTATNATDNDDILSSSEGAHAHIPLDVKS